jgi:glycosyltransferase involved in cell wall biosynthesis
VNIGIDARLLTMPVTGIGRYTAELSSELLAQGHDLSLYMPQSPVVGDWSAPNARVRAGRIRGRIGRMLWSQTVLPWQAGRDCLDVFWGPGHRLPRYLSPSVARVVTIHDLVWKHAGETMRPLSRLLDSTLMPDAVRLADRIMAVSRSTADDVEAEFPEARGKVRVVYPGVTALSAPADPGVLRELGVRQPYFLFVGTLEPRKNLRRLLGAYARLPQAVRSAHQFVIAGGKGWGGVDVPDLLTQMGLMGQVLVTGYVTDGQLSTLYANARFLAMPSLYEGFGFPLIEAMSFGVPVVTADISSLPEVAGEAGVLVNPRDEAAIANGLLRLLTDDALHAELAGKARANAARFTWRAAAQSALQVFAEAVDARRAMLGRT